MRRRLRCVAMVVHVVRDGDHSEMPMYTRRLPSDDGLEEADLLLVRPRVGEGVGRRWYILAGTGDA